MVCDSFQRDIWRECPARCSRKEWITEKTFKGIFQPKKRDPLELILTEMGELQLEWISKTQRKSKLKKLKVKEK